jgi:hypothetical protein
LLLFLLEAQKMGEIQTHPSIAASIKNENGFEWSEERFSVLTKAQLLSAANVFRSSVIGLPIAHRPAQTANKKKS